MKVKFGFNDGFIKEVETSTYMFKGIFYKGKRPNKIILPTKALLNEIELNNLQYVLGSGGSILYEDSSY